MTNNNLLKEIQKQELEAQAFGFCWQHLHQIIEQVQSECLEIQEAWEKKHIPSLQEEVGDLMHIAITLAVFCQLDPEETLLKSIEKFQQRYNKVVQMAQKEGFKTLQNQPFEVLINYWNRAKVNEVL